LHNSSCVAVLCSKLLHKRHFMGFNNKKSPYFKGFRLNGGGAGIRTPDTANMSRMLYHLSYTAVLNKLKVKNNYFKA
jgi:hypothetical protein